MSSRYEDLNRIHQLKADGILSDSEYEAEKARILQPPVREVVKSAFDNHVAPAMEIVCKIGLVVIFAFLVFVAVMIWLESAHR